MLGAADAAAQLIELGQAEHIGAVNDQGVGGGNVEARFHDSGGEQHIEFPVIETGHDVFQFGGRHAAMGGAEFYLGDILAQELAHFGEIGDARDDIEALPAAEMFAQQGFADDDGIKGRDIGAHRQAVQGRRGDQRKLAHAGERQLQGAGNGRGGERQHMHIGAQFLQALLVLHAEVLLFIDDEQAQIAELDAGGEQRMGADDDIDVAGLQARFHRVNFLAAHEP